MAWDDDKRQAAVDAYLAAEPTPENSADIVKDIEFDADTSSKILMAAIEYYKKKDGAIDKKAKIDATGHGKHGDDDRHPQHRRKAPHHKKGDSTRSDQQSYG